MMLHFSLRGASTPLQVLNNDYLEHKRLYAAVQSVLAAEAQRGPLDVLVSCCTSSPAPMQLCLIFAC